MSFFNYQKSDKWFCFGESFVNLTLAIRIFQKNDKNITVEYPNGNCPYEFKCKEDADIVMKKMWKFLNE